MKQNKNVFIQYDTKSGRDLLYKPSRRVKDIKSSEVIGLINEMKDKLGQGIGLAANQLGYPLQLFMMEFTAEQKSVYPERFQELDLVPLQIFINPKIIQASDKNKTFWHKCLSADGMNFGKVATYEWIEYEAMNHYGEFIMGKLDNLGAIIFQHEFRHLLGSTYLEKAKEYKTKEELTILILSGELKTYADSDGATPHLLDDYIIGETIEEYEARQLH